MKYTRIPLLLCLFALSSISLSAAKIYVLFDPSCMDQLEFKQTRPDGRSDYYVYHVNIRSGEKLVLEVGEEGNAVQNFIPTPYLSCQTGGFDQGLMRRINTNIDEVYLVYPKSDKKYIISRVTTASYYTKKGNIVSYESPKYRFRFDTEFGTIGENIAVNNPGSKVYFEGRVENPCTGAYLFRQLSPQSAYPLIDLVLIPEIGIVQENSGANAAVAQNNGITLNRMNGKASDRYLLEVCGTEPGSVGSMLSAAQPIGPTDYNTNRGVSYNPPPGNLPPGAIVASGNPAPSYPTTTVNRPSDPAVSNTTIPNTVQATTQNTTPVPTATTHTVKSGETLYRIAREHNISVNQIKSVNGLTSNTIRRGQVLQLDAPASVQQTVVTNTPAVPSQSLQSRGIGTGNTLSGSPVPYGQTTGRISTTTDDIHIVKPGETVASIALNYGYTAKRFRDMNDLGSNDYVKIGQRLKVSDCNCDTATSTSSYQSPSNLSVPNSYNNSTGGRITPSNLAAKTPINYNQAVATPNNTGAAIRNSGGLPAYSNPSVPAAVTYKPNPYNDVVPNAYEVISQPQKSLLNLENSTNNTTAREVPRSYNATPQSYNQSPVSNYNYVAPTASPYPTPNIPISNNNVVDVTTSSQRQVHIVSEGESLYGIARRYSTTPERLRQINNLGPNDPIISYQTLYVE